MSFSSSVNSCNLSICDSFIESYSSLSKFKFCLKNSFNSSLVFSFVIFFLIFLSFSSLLGFLIFKNFLKLSFSSSFIPSNSSIPFASIENKFFPSNSNDFNAISENFNFSFKYLLTSSLVLFSVNINSFSCSCSGFCSSTSSCFCPVLESFSGFDGSFCPFFNFSSFKNFFRLSFSSSESSVNSSISLSLSKNMLSPSKSKASIDSFLNPSLFFKNLATSSFVLFLVMTIICSFLSSFFESFRYFFKFSFSFSVNSVNSSISGSFNKYKLSPSKAKASIASLENFNLISKNFATSSSLLFLEIIISSSSFGGSSIFKVLKYSIYFGNFFL